MICAEDTDAFVLTLAFHDKIRVPLYQKCGNKARSRIVDITEVAAKIVMSACQALLGMPSLDATLSELLQVGERPRL